MLFEQVLRPRFQRREGANMWQVLQGVIRYKQQEKGNNEPPKLGIQVRFPTVQPREVVHQREADSPRADVGEAIEVERAQQVHKWDGKECRLMIQNKEDLICEWYLMFYNRLNI